MENWSREQSQRKLLKNIPLINVMWRVSALEEYNTQNTHFQQRFIECSSCFCKLFPYWYANLSDSDGMGWGGGQENEDKVGIWYTNLKIIKPSQHIFIYKSRGKTVTTMKHI